MPDKEGAEEKSTKSVVNKKQKQMMGEEGYDVARDMGRVKPSKDKKDATTMPPSKEMEKTRKVNKGPSALERVKKKYEGQIMDVKKEELDLTQVAEAFGGYIIEAPVDSEGNVNPKKGDAGKERRLINKEIKKITKPKPGEKKSAKQTVQKFIKSTKTTQRSADATGRMDSRNPKMGGGASTFDLSPEPGDKRKLEPTTVGGPVKIIKKGVKKPKVTVVQTNVKSTPDKPKKAAKDALKQIKKDTKVMGTPTPEVTRDIAKQTKSTRKPRVFSYMRKISPEAQKKVDAVKREIEMKNIIKPDRRLKSSRVATSSPEFGEPKIPSTKKPSVNLTKPSDVELPKSFKDFSSKLKSLKSDVKQSKINLKNFNKKTEQTSRVTFGRGKYDDPKRDPNYDIDQLKKRGMYGKYKEIKDTTPKGGIPKWMKDFDKRQVARQLRQKSAAAAGAARGGVVKTLKRVVKNPVGTAIAAGIARDSFRAPQLPPMPKLQGGRVGRRTAG